MHGGFLVTVFDDLADNGVCVTDNLVGLFRGVLPDPAARRQFDGLPFRTRRGMVPDGRVTLRMAELFVELKFLHWGTTTYSDAHLRHASRCRSVTVRAGC